MVLKPWVISFKSVFLSRVCFCGRHGPVQHLVAYLSTIDGSRANALSSLQFAAMKTLLLVSLIIASETLVIDPLSPSNCTPASAAVDLLNGRCQPCGSNQQPTANGTALQLFKGLNTTLI